VDRKWLRSSWSWHQAPPRYDGLASVGLDHTGSGQFSEALRALRQCSADFLACLPKDLTLIGKR
jgi:hypothetical protein